MSDDETRPEDTAPDAGTSAGTPEAGALTPPDSAEVPEVPARDNDENPDEHAGDFTDPDVDVDLAVEPDEDGE